VFQTFSTSPAACLTIIRKLCYKLPSIVTFTAIQIFDQNFVFFSERRKVAAADQYSIKICNFALFLVAGLKDKKVIKKQTYMKTNEN